MNFIADCQITLSNKIKGIFSQAEPIVIYVSPVHKNKAMAQIRFVGPNDLTQKKIEEIGQTSLLIELGQLYQDAPNIQEMESPVGNIFTQDVERDAMQEGQEENVVAKVTSGTTQRMAEKNRVQEMADEVPQPPPMPPALDIEIQSPPPQPPQQRAMPVQEPVEKPSAPATKKKTIVIRDHDDLMGLLENLPGIEKDLPEAKEQMSRDEAITYEKKLNRLPKIPISIYLKNNRKGSFEIQDVDLMLKDGEVIDLSRVPARKIYDSRDLRICMENGFVRFAQKSEHDAWMRDQETKMGRMSGEAVAADGRGLKTYGSMEEAAEALYNDSSKDFLSDKKESSFIDSKKQESQQTVVRPKRVEEMEYTPMDMTNEVKDLPENLDNYEPNDLEYVDPELRDMVKEFPEKRNDDRPLPKTPPVESPTHKPIKKVVDQ